MSGNAPPGPHHLRSFLPRAIAARGAVRGNSSPYFSTASALFAKTTGVYPRARPACVSLCSTNSSNPPALPVTGRTWEHSGMEVRRFGWVNEKRERVSDETGRKSVESGAVAAWTGGIRVSRGRARCATVGQDSIAGRVGQSDNHARRGAVRCVQQVRSGKIFELLHGKRGVLSRP